MTRICSAGLLAFFLLATASQAADWNQWRGAARDGYAPDSPKLIDALPSAGLEPVWISEAEIPSGRSGGWGSPAVVGGKVYIFTHQRVLKDGAKLPERKFPWLPPDKRTGMTPQEYAEYEVNRRDEDEALGTFYRYAEIVYCIDAATGKTVWTSDQTSIYTRFLHSGTPAVVEGRLYVLGAGLKARCLDAATGESLWQTQLPGEFRDEFLQSSFVAAEGVAVVFARQLFGLDAATGDLLWQAGEENAGTLHTSPTVWAAPGGAVAISNLPGGKTIGVDLKTGKPLWQIESLGGNATPIVVGDRLLTYGSSRKAGLRCYRLSEGGPPQSLWTFQGAADSGSSPVVVGDMVFVQGERRLACVDLASGEEAWRTTLDVENPRYTSLVAADDKVFYAQDGMLCFSAADKYRPLMRAKVDKQGLMAEEAAFRKRLDIEALETTAEGQAQAQKLWQRTFSGAGPLTCSTPAIVDGRIYFRFADRLACYDLRAAGAE